jgi:hypothetical protein
MEESGALSGVLGPESLWNQSFNGLTKQFLSVIPEQALDLCIDQRDDALLVSQEHAIWSRFNDLDLALGQEELVGLELSHSDKMLFESFNQHDRDNDGEYR